MCSTLINYITIHDDFVKESTAEKNLYPHEYHTSINSYYTRMLANEGKEKVLIDILNSFEGGCYQSGNTKNNLIYLYAIEINRSRLNELNSIIYDFDNSIGTYKHSEEERKTAQEEKDNLLLQGYYKALDIKKNFRGKKYYITFDDENIIYLRDNVINYVTKINATNIHYDNRGAYAKKFTMLECEYYKLKMLQNYDTITSVNFLEV